MDHLLDLSGIFDVFDFQDRRGLVGALQQDAAHAEDALAQGDLHADIAHAVKQDLLKLHVEQPLFAEDPIVGHGIFGEGDRQAEDAGAVGPPGLDVFFCRHETCPPSMLFLPL